MKKPPAPVAPVIATPAPAPVRILIASSELHPYSKTGGLADMVIALAKTMARQGHQVGVVTPLYAGIAQRFPAIQRMDYHLRLPVGPDWVEGEIMTLNPEPNLTIYFVGQAGYFMRPGIYGENNRDYPDNAQRFIFFSKAVVHLARYLPWRPEVVHVHDWQAGLVPQLMQHERDRAGWVDAPPSLLTIHNLAYQGVFPEESFVYTNMPEWEFSPSGAEFHGFLNCLKSGILRADQLTTVSPRYAREITTAEYGCGLDPILRFRGPALRGILNGVDYEEWQTETNPHLAAVYSSRKPEGKAICKAALQSRMGLPVRADVPLFGSVTRLADQKGMDILLGSLEEMLSTDMQFVLLGSGAPELEREYLRLVQRFPGKVAAQIGYNHALSHQIEAGIDFFLMPSRFEPCGLNQMYSLRYGSIPVVRVTGGLDDSVIDWLEDARKADGVKFQEYSSRALAKAIRKALAIYKSPKLHQQYRSHAMAADFSWERTGQAYEDLYRITAGGIAVGAVEPLPS